MVSRGAVKQCRLAFLTGQVVADQAPLFRLLARHPKIDLTVYFGWDIGVREAGVEREFDVAVKLDPSLLDGYAHRFPRNLSLRPSSSFFGQINPGVAADLLAKRYDALIVHGWSHATDWLAYAAAFVSGTPVLLRGEAVLRPGRPLWLRAAKRAVFTPLFRGMAAFLSMGSWSEKFYRHYGVPAKKIFFTPSAVDNDGFMDANRRLRGPENAVRRELGMGKNDTLFLFAGKIVARKRPLDLLDAFRRAFGERRDVRLLFVGDGNMRGEIEERARAERMENVSVAGFRPREELPAYYAAADAFVLPSEATEVCPVVVNEAMCFGLPVVVSDVIPSARDFVADGENGFIVPLGGVEELAERLRTLADDPGTRARLGARSAERIRGWSYERDLDGVLSALQYIHAV